MFTIRPGQRRRRIEYLMKANEMVGDSCTKYFACPRATLKKCSTIRWLGEDVQSARESAQYEGLGSCCRTRKKIRLHVAGEFHGLCCPGRYLSAAPQQHTDHRLAIQPITELIVIANRPRKESTERFLLPARSLTSLSAPCL